MLAPEHKAVLEKYVSTHDGKPVDSKAMLKPNTMIEKVLLARIMSMTPEQQQTLKSIVTPDNAQVLEILLPEAKQVISKVTGNG